MNKLFTFLLFIALLPACTSDDVVPEEGAYEITGTVHQKTIGSDLSRPKPSSSGVGASGAPTALYSFIVRHTVKGKPKYTTVYVHPDVWDRTEKGDTVTVRVGGYSYRDDGYYY